MAQYPELMRLLYVAGFELPGADRMFREHLGPIFDSVNAYFGRCAARGAIGNLEPTFATLGLAGAVSAHRNLHQPVYRTDLPWDAQALTPAYAQFWLNALRQPSGASASQGLQAAGVNASDCNEDHVCLVVIRRPSADFGEHFEISAETETYRYLPCEK